MLSLVEAFLDFPTESADCKKPPRCRSEFQIRFLFGLSTVVHFSSSKFALFVAERSEFTIFVVIVLVHQSQS